MSPEVLHSECLTSDFVFFICFSLLYEVDVFGQLGKAAGVEAGGEGCQKEEGKVDAYCWLPSNFVVRLIHLAFNSVLEYIGSKCWFVETRTKAGESNIKITLILNF